MSGFVFDHVGLSVGDLDLQRNFYGRSLGLTEIDERVEVPEAQVRTVILRGDGGLKIELIERGGSPPLEFSDPFDGAGTQGYFHWALDVENLDTVFGQMLEA